MAKQELSKQSIKELREQENLLRKEIMEQRFDHATGKLLNTAGLKQKRKALARVLTAMNAQTNLGA